VISCTLERRFTLRTPDAVVFDAVRFLECTPEIVGAEFAEVTIDIEMRHDGYRIIENDRLLDQPTSVQGVVDDLHLHLFDRSLEDRPRAALLHAACLRRGKQRLLIAGTKGAGKTTLAIRLIEAGYSVEGDEQVFIGSGGVTARPRGCRVKATSLSYLKGMADIIAAAPSYTLEEVGTVFNVDPRTLGSTWRIEHGEVDCVIVLEPNHGGRSSIRRLPATMMVQSLMPEIGLRETGRAAMIAALAALANRAPAYRLSLGDHEGALRCIEAALDG
jgi:hypothetical protein